MWHAIASPTDFILLSDQGLQGGELKPMTNDHLSIFCRLDPFLQVFGQFKAWIILNFADIVNFMSLILCPIIFCQ